MRTRTVILTVLVLLTAAPLVAAEPAPSQPHGAATWCVDVNPESPNPVYVYECPDPAQG